MFLVQRQLSNSFVRRAFQASYNHPSFVRIKKENFLLLNSSRRNLTMASMKAANRAKVVMEEGKTAFGCWQMAPGSNVSRTLASTGVDFVVVDCERKFSKTTPPTYGGDTILETNPVCRWEHGW